MTTTIHLNEAELDSQFLQAVKTLFKNRDIKVTIEADDTDTTAYLMSTATNRSRLLEAIQRVDEGQHLTEVDLAQLKALLPDA
nr:hypothetical protein [uncultured Arsenicibacter sp.]